MKHILVISLVLALMYTVQGAANSEMLATFINLVQKIGMECIEEVQPDDDDIARLASKQNPETHEGKCVIACVSKKIKVMDADGKPNYETTTGMIEHLKTVEPELAEKMKLIFEKCHSADLLDSDPCITAYNHLVCGRNAAKEVGVDESAIL